MFCPKRTESIKTASSTGAAEKSLLSLRFMAAATAILLLLAAALFVLAGCSGSNSDASSDTEAISKTEVGENVQFGNYEWHVLAKENGKALLITEDIIEIRAYNDNRDTNVWENCSLRSYLNGEFFDGFSDGQKKAIAETKNTNPDNPDYGTAGGNDTTDKVFCLSVDEADKYFETDDDRIAKHKGEACSWWLRTPGSDNGETVTYVGSKGEVCMSGHFVDYVESGYGGVRPAMWVNL